MATRIRRRPSAYVALTWLTAEFRATRGGVGPLEHLDLAVLRDALGSDPDRMGSRDRSALEADHPGRTVGASGRGRRGGRRVAQTLRGQVGGVRVPGRVAAHDPHPGPPPVTGDEVLHPAVIEADTR